MAIKTGTDSGEQIDGTNTDDQLFGLGGNDLLLGNDGNDFLSGGDGSGTLQGGNGDDKLEGGNGNDRSVGGDGQDSFIVNIENAASGNQIDDFTLGVDRIDLSKLGIADFATIQSILGDSGTSNSGFGFYRNDAWLTTVILSVVKDDLIASDFIFSTATSNDTETGGNLRDYLFGGLGNDILSGGLGVDRLFGEGGDDKLYGNTAALGGAADGNDILYGGGGNDQLFGGGDSDRLFGGDGNDQLDGGGNSDFMTGGAGSDVFAIHAENSSQNDTLNDFDVTQDKLDVSTLGISEFDTIKALSVVSTTGILGIIYYVNDSKNEVYFIGVLPNSLSTGNVYFAASSTHDTRTGDTQNNDLFGGWGNDKLSGGLGNDRLFGEQGDDQLFGNDSTNPAGSDTDGKDLLYGGAGNDQLWGGGNDDNLTGGLGDDILTGGTGSDTLDGGGGLDTASYLDSSVAVTVRLWENSVANGDAAGDMLNNIENITGSKQSNDVLVGNALNNVLDGSSGADYLNGREGNDSYFIDNPNDSISDRSGNDTVNSTFSYTLSDFLENLTLLGTGALNGAGNASNNTLTGNAGNNSLNGLNGIDTVSYRTATASVTVSLAIASAQNTLGAGTDTLLSFENLTGSGFNDTLVGNGNSNILTGAAGADRLTGGASADIFIFNSTSGFDTVTDFAFASDKLQFSQTGIRIGDGDTLLEGGTVRASGTGGFANSAELVIMQQNISGTINTTTAAAAIGSATAAYTLGKTVLFAVDNGTASGLFLFTAANTDALVTTDELTPVAIIGNTATTALADYGFIA